MISKFVSEFATLQKDEQQREKERLRELELGLARAAEESDDGRRPLRASPSAESVGTDSGASNTNPGNASELKAKLQETERVLAKKLRHITALEERLRGAERAGKEQAAIAAELARLQDRSQELEEANGQLEATVRELTTRLAACSPAAHSGAEAKLDEVSQVYELLSHTEARLNAAEGAAAQAAHDLERCRARLAAETGLAAAVTAERDATLRRVQELEAAVKTLKASQTAEALQELQRKLQDVEKQHQQELARQLEARAAEELEWRRKNAELEARCQAALDDSSKAGSHAVNVVADAVPRQELALETWCLRVVVGLVACSIMAILFLRRVVPHTTICMRDMGAT